MLNAFSLARLVIAWGVTVIFLFFGKTLLGDLASPGWTAVLFAILLGVIVWCAFGVVEEADHLAEMLGEPMGTLILTLAIVTIEVALISAVMLTPNAAPTLGRDTMFAVLMIILNGVVGLVLLLGGLRYHEQSYNLQGASAYLAIILPLSVIALVLPNFTITTAGATLSVVQAFCFSLFTVMLYGVFLGVQTVRHRSFFEEPQLAAFAEPTARVTKPPASSRRLARHVVLLVLAILPIVLLAKQLAKLIDHGIDTLGAPPALGGVLIALVVFTPEGLTAIKAALANQLQRSVNLCLGAAASTIGLTVPAVLGIGLFTGQRVELGLDPTGMVLLVLTLALSLLTFSGQRTTVLEGTVHLVVFFVYIVLIFSP